MARAIYLCILLFAGYRAAIGIQGEQKLVIILSSFPTGHRYIYIYIYTEKEIILGRRGFRCWGSMCVYMSEVSTRVKGCRDDSTKNLGET